MVKWTLQVKKVNWYILYPVTKALILWMVLRTVVLGFTKVRFVCFTPPQQRNFRILWRMTPNLVLWAAEGLRSDEKWKGLTVDRESDTLRRERSHIPQNGILSRWFSELPVWWDMLIPWRVCLGEVYKLYLYQLLPMVHGPIVKTSVCMNLLWLHHCL